MRIFTQIFILLLLVQCQVDNKTIKIDDIVATDTLVSNALTVKENILMPTKIFAIEDKLLIFDHAKTNIFKVFKLPDLEFLYSFGNKGKGPDEFTFIDPNSMKMIDNELCFLDNYTIKWISVEDDRMLITKKKTIKIEKAPTNRLCLMNDSIYVADAFFHDEFKHEFQKVNISKKAVIEKFGNYPNEKIDFKEDIDKYLAFMKASTSNLRNDKIVSFYLYFNRLKIFDINGKLLKDVVIKHNHPKYKPEAKNDNIIYRVEPFATNKFIYVLNIERSKRDFESNISTFMPKLEIWSWQGELLKKYILDKPIIAFTISDDNSKLYGTSILNMNEIYEFDLPKQLNISHEKEFKEIQNHFYKINIPSTWEYSTSTPVENKDVVQESKIGMCNTNIFVNPNRVDKCGTSMWIGLILNDKDLHLNEYVASRDSLVKVISNSYVNRVESVNDKAVIYSNFTIKDEPPGGEKFTANTSIWTWKDDEIIVEIKFTSCNEYDKTIGTILKCISSFSLNNNSKFKPIS